MNTVGDPEPGLFKLRTKLHLVERPCSSNFFTSGFKYDSVYPLLNFIIFAR
jgi:hypothetical protein